MNGHAAVGEAEVDQILAELTDEEKVLLLEGARTWTTNAIERLGIPSLYLTDGPHGVRRIREGSGSFDIADCEPATAFPTAATVANSWDPENARRVGRAIGEEAIALGVDVVLAPGVNIKRSPLCGRNFEYYSEDPLVAGEFGAAFVEGLQSTGVACSVKHFAANSNEDFRFVGDSVVDERALREIYLRAFERTVRRARPATVMAAYNAINGTWATEHRELLTGVLRDEWGFDGLVMTDWGATHDRVAAVTAGCDLEMPGAVARNRRALLEALRDGRLSRDALDTAVRRMLRLVRDVSTATAGRAGSLAHDDVATEVAIDSAVLLQNDGALPLSPGDELVVIGELFERMRFQGAGSSLVNPPAVTTPRDAFDRRGIRYRYARGYLALQDRPDERLEREALDLARGASTVLVFAGLGDLEESEGFDRRSMRLSSAQVRLIERLLGTGSRVVLVLFGGAPVELPFADRLAAVLHMYLPGQRGGEATAALLFGEANPSGKLAESWPLTAADSSAAADFDREQVARYAESVYVGYRSYDAAGTPLRYPFGHGLSYTAFRYDDLEARIEGDRVIAEFTLANAGDRDGAEAVQLYVRNNAGAVFKPEKELRGFTKVRLAAGASARVRIEFPLRDLAYWDVAEHDWVLENGAYEVLVAASAADIRLRAPLEVTTGRDSRSPYPAEVDRAYATPPRGIPEAFEALLGRPVPRPRRSRRLTLDTRLGDARRSITGALLFAAVLGRARRDFRRALRMPDSLERDAKVKNTHFLLRMLPSNSLRSFVMSSAGAFPYHVADGIADIAAFHPVRGLRKILSGDGDRAGADA